MKIVFLQDDFPPHSEGGAGFSTYELARGMRRAGHQVSVVTTVRDSANAGEKTYEDLHVYALESTYQMRWRAWVGLYNPRTVSRIEEVLKELQPDVVHINNIHAHLSYHTFKLAKRYAKAVVFTARDTMAFTYGKLDTQRYRGSLDAHTTWYDHVRQAKKGYNPFRNVLIRWYLGYADSIVAVSNSLREAFRSNGITNVSVIHTGTDVSLWQASAEEVDSFKRKHELEGKRVLFYGGRMSEGKGGGKALDALECIVREIPETVLVIAGKVDGYGESLRQSAEARGLSQNLMFLGWVGREGMRVAYGASDVVLVPSTYLDPFPRAVIEAMACGKPVVGTRYGGAPEIIADGVTGYVVNPLHSEDIARKTIDLLKSKEKATQFGRAGFERIRGEFSTERMVREYTEEYESVMRNRKL